MNPMVQYISNTHQTGMKCPNCNELDLMVYAPIENDRTQRNKWTGVLYCPECGDMVKCAVCGEFHDYDGRTGYTLCHICKSATCHKCGDEVGIIYDGSAEDGQMFIWSARCSKCGEEW